MSRQKLMTFSSVKWIAATLLKTWNFGWGHFLSVLDYSDVIYSREQTWHSVTWVEINGSILKCLCHLRANHQPNWETLESCCCTVAYAQLKYSSVVPGRFNLYHPSLFFIIEQIQVRFTSSIKFGLFLHLFRWTSKITLHITGIANTCFYRSVAYRHAQLESLFILYYL